MPLNRKVITDTNLLSTWWKKLGNHKKMKIMRKHWINGKEKQILLLETVNPSKVWKNRDRLNRRGCSEKSKGINTTEMSEARVVLTNTNKLLYGAQFPHL